MRYSGTVLAVADVNASRRFYEDLFGLELYQDYGINIAFTCGLSLQQDFAWLVGLPPERVQRRPDDIELCFETTDLDGFLNKLADYPDLERLGGVIEHSWGQRVLRFYDPDGHLIEVGEDMRLVIQRFQAAGMSMEEISRQMDASVDDLSKLLQRQE